MQDYFSLPRPEYPRPDFAREEWMTLNGKWEFCFDDENLGMRQGWFDGRALPGEIVVPFCYQSIASGIGQTDEKHEVLWYARSFSVPATYPGRRVLLHFGAVDYRADVWVNGTHIGSHTGGYTPFALDITHTLYGEGEHRLCVRVEDRYDPIQPRGKQNWKDKPFGCWYTAVSGIWQSVWLEPVEESHLQSVRITPDIDARQVHFEIYPTGPIHSGRLDLHITYSDAQNTVYSSAHSIRDGSSVVKLTADLREACEVDNIHYWTPDTPNLYDVQLQLWCGDKLTDTVSCYFGMRKIDICDGVIRLNNAPCYQKLILDQGYWPDTLLTPPSDEAIRRDIELTKEMGFNGARKHQKIEDPRYYYWADRLGLLVWGELPSPYEYCSAEMEALVDTAKAFVARDYNHPSIIFWAPLNESWGIRNIVTDPAQQRFAESMYALLRALDPTRLVSTNDGWEQVKSDICAIHDYTAWTSELDPGYSNIERLAAPNGQRMLYADGYRYCGQPVLITEYGGIAFAADSTGENWGYNGSVEDEKQFLSRYSDITAGFRALPYVQGYCYTQLTDVFQEVNGLLDMDRNPKAAMQDIQKVNE